MTTGTKIVAAAVIGIAVLATLKLAKKTAELDETLEEKGKKPKKKMKVEK